MVSRGMKGTSMIQRFDQSGRSCSLSCCIGLLVLGGGQSFLLVCDSGQYMMVAITRIMMSRIERTPKKSGGGLETSNLSLRCIVHSPWIPSPTCSI